MSDYNNYLQFLRDENESVSSDTSLQHSTASTASRSRKRAHKTQDNNEENSFTLPKQRRSEYSHVGGAGHNAITPEDQSDPGEGTSRGPASRLRNRMPNMPIAPFQRGTDIYTDSNVRIHIQSVEHQRHTRFRAEDHLFQIKIYPNRRSAPLLLALETALENALFQILQKLKTTYSHDLHHQIYLTIIEQNILHGLNTGNYDLSAPPHEIVNRALTILHSYLKSNQTMKLNDSFKIQIKILSQNHTSYSERYNPTFKKKIFRDYTRIRN